jgi:hypothetical protein
MVKQSWRIFEDGGNARVQSEKYLHTALTKVVSRSVTSSILSSARITCRKETKTQRMQNAMKFGSHTTTHTHIHTRECVYVKNPKLMYRSHGMAGLQKGIVQSAAVSDALQGLCDNGTFGERTA